MRTLALVLALLILPLSAPMSWAAEDAAGLPAKGSAAFEQRDWESARVAYEPLTQIAPTDGGAWVDQEDPLVLLRPALPRFL
jgi:hypothetical protein